MIKIFRTDGGGEYVGHKMQQFLTTHGILHQSSCPYTPKQNGIAERKHRHIIETAITLIYQSSLPLTYWFDAVATAVFLVNRLPNIKLQNLTPFEALFHQPPDFNLFKVSVVNVILG